MRLTVIVLALALAPGGALAQVPSEIEPASIQSASGWQPVGSELHVDVLAGTAFPLSIGGAVQAELPYRIQVRVDLGWMPGAYVDAINAFLVGVGAYDELTADLIAAAISSSFVLRASAGWRPFEHEGFEVMVGYTLATAGGGLTPAEVAEAATGQSVERGTSSEVPMTATLHAVHAWLAWAIEPVRYWVIRFAIGFVGTVAASASVGETCTRPMGCPGQRAAQAYLVDTLTSYAFTPDVQVTTGVRF